MTSNLNISKKFIIILASILVLSASTSILANDEQRADDYFNEGRMLYDKSDFGGAVSKFEQALEICRTVGNEQGVQNCLISIALAHKNLGNYLKSLKYFEEVLEIYRQIGDEKGVGDCLNTIGQVHMELDDYPKALEYYEQSLAIAKTIGDKKSVGWCLNNIGLVYADLSNYPKALEYYEQALEISREIGKKKGVGATLGNIGSVYQDLSNYPKALEYQEQSLKILRDIGDKKSVGIVLQDIGSIYKGLSNYSKALEYYEQSLEIAKTIGDKPGVGSCLGSIGWIYLELGDYPKAFEFFKKALEICIEIEDKSGVSSNLNGLGNIYRIYGDYPNALKFFEQSLKIDKEIGDKSGIAERVAMIGLVYGELGNYSKALESLEQVIVVFREIGDKDRVKDCLSLIGRCYMVLGDYPKSLGYFEQSLKIAKEIGDRQGVGAALSNIGSVYGKLGNYSKALENQEQALEIFKGIGDKPAEIEVLAGIGDIYLKQEDYKKALGFFIESNNSFGLGAVYNKMGNFQKALTYYEEALKIGLKIERPDILINSYFGMGESYEGLGKLEEAAASYISAVSIVDKLRSGLKKEKHKTGFLSRTVQLYKKLVSALARLHIQGEELTDDDILKNLGNIGEISFYIAENVKARSLIEMLAGRMGTEETYRLPKNIIEKEQSLTHQIAKLNEQLEDAFKKDKELFEKKKETLNALEAELEQFTYELRESHPRYAAFKYPQPLSIKDIPITSNEILLEYHVSDEATYLFVVGQDKQKQNKLIKLIEVPISEEDLKEQINVFRHAFEDIRYMNEFDPMKAKELYGLLLAEGVKDLPVGSHLIIIPDGILNLLPFEALVVSTDNLNGNENLNLAKDNIGDLQVVGVKGKVSDTESKILGYKDIEYFGDKWSTSYYQSGTVLGLNRTLGKKEQKWPKPLFALGDPVFDKEDNRYVNYAEGKQEEIKLASLNIESSVRIRSIIREKGYTFRRLVETRDEVIQIGQMLDVNNPWHIKLDMEASEAGVKGTDLLGYRYIHFATHGILENEIPYIQEPALVLNLVNNENGEDGYLTMSEVMGLNLSADMVVLSACKTGLGEDIGGEGIVGLTRAFMYAGSPSVVVSLWSVESKTTTDFMIAMYRYLEEGKDKAEAVRLARMDIRKKKYRTDTERGVGGIMASERMEQKSNRVIDTSHPYFWSPFILVGEWEVDSSKKYGFIKEDVSTTEISVSDKQGKFEDKHEPPNVSIKSTQPIPKDNISISKEKPVDGDNTLTKEKVLQKLGKPDSTHKWSATERWSYGTSYVEFDNGIFVRCYEPDGENALRKKLNK